MAGSYGHCVDDQGALVDSVTLAGMLENGGDVWEAVEQMYGMIWFLADGQRDRVDAAQVRWAEGVSLSPWNPLEGLGEVF